jgi:beta-N-acetylhexosaminidase
MVRHLRAPCGPAAVLTVPLAVPLAMPLLIASLGGCGGDQAVPQAATTTRDSVRQQQNSPDPGGSAIPRNSWIRGFVAAMSPEEKVGQLFVPALSGRSEALSMIKHYHVGGFIYFPRNTRTPGQTARLSNALQDAARVPLLLGVDEEQGQVSRLPYLTAFPGNMALGASRRPEVARAAARITGTELRAVGINQNYAPVADVNVNPDNPVIGLRSFGSDPALTARMIAAAVDGYQAAGVAATAKHFPGHGDTATDSHTGLPVIEHSRRRWARLDAPPFAAAIAHQVDAIMTAHIVVPGLDRSGDPATLSAAVLTGLLRGRLGFQGVIITDSLSMAGPRVRYGPAEVPVRAVAAGADQLLMPPSLPLAYRAVLRAVHEGTISQARLNDAVSRIVRLKEIRGLFAGRRADPSAAEKITGSPAHRAVARSTAEHAITLVENDGVLPLHGGKRIRVTGVESARVAAALRRQGVRVVHSARDADATVLTTLNAGTATASQVHGLRGRPVIVVALGRPYDLGHTRHAAAALATYSTGDAAVEALARVLTGKVRPTGKLPVAVSRTYPFGRGLSY